MRFFPRVANSFLFSSFCEKIFVLFACFRLINSTLTWFTFYAAEKRKSSSGMAFNINGVHDDKLLCRFFRVASIFRILLSRLSVPQLLPCRRSEFRNRRLLSCEQAANGFNCFCCLVSLVVRIIIRMNWRIINHASLEPTSADYFDKRPASEC